MMMWKIQMTPCKLSWFNKVVVDVVTMRMMMLYYMLGRGRIEYKSLLRARLHLDTAFRAVPRRRLVLFELLHYSILILLFIEEEDLHRLTCFIVMYR